MRQFSQYIVNTALRPKSQKEKRYKQLLVDIGTAGWKGDISFFPFIKREAGPGWPTKG